jgi:ferric-dicitrate binding protein FerR (iron transport regulator)
LASLSPAQPVRELASAAGSRTTITLRDGTTLVLGPASRLRVPADFGRQTRTVDLDGEALLTVVHDARHPFAVRTARATVRDIGTTFAVRAYRDDPVDRVVVAQGEVAIGNVTLGARDGASVDAAGRVTVERSIDPSHDLAWAQGELAFKDTPLSDVVRELARFYDVDVKVADNALEAKPVTGTFRGQTVDEVLKEIAFAVGGRYERSGRSVVIRRGVGAAGRAGEHGSQERAARERVTR